jgi:hypothetical protein
MKEVDVSFIVVLSFGHMSIDLIFRVEFVLIKKAGFVIETDFAGQ